MKTYKKLFGLVTLFLALGILNNYAQDHGLYADFFNNASAKEQLTTQLAKIEPKISRPFEYSGYTHAEYASYQRSSVFVTMSDGTKIAVDIYLPDQFTGSGPAPTKFPVVFQYTPYQRASMRPDGTISDATGGSWGSLIQLLLSYGYTIVVADMRGSGASYGWMADFMKQFGDDGKELVDWIAQQPWCDGNVGMTGMSYNGWSQLCVASRAPEALKCIMPTAVPLDGYTGQVYPGGIYSYAFTQLWSGGQYPKLRNFTGSQAAPVVDEDGDGYLSDEIPIDQNKNGTFLDDYPPQYPDGVVRTAHYYFFATMQHAAHPGGAPGDYDYDKWVSQAYFIDSPNPVGGWTASELCANLVPRVMDSKIPVYNVGGWFDAFTRGTFELFCTMRETNPSRILMRPSYHGTVSQGFAELFGIDLLNYNMGLNIEALRWYDRWLKGINNGIDREPPILIYSMNGKGWRQEESWPLEKEKLTSFYFGEWNELTLNAPKVPGVCDLYDADYSHNSGWETLNVSFLALINRLIGKAQPVTTTFYKNRYLAVAGMMPSGLPIRTEMDQKCLTYTTQPLRKNTEVTGHPIVQLWVSSTTADADLYFYLEDVDKSGKAILVSEYPLTAGFAALYDNDMEITTNDGVDVLPNLPWHGYAEDDYVDGIFTGGNIVEIVNDLNPTSWVFKEGHSIRVSIACADWPTFRLNQRLCPTNKPDDLSNVVPTITMYRSAEYPSHIELPVIETD